ncbi:MAG TPA: hypothetical protein VLY04_20600 [Bryobacteraceae bacterium]|nr:hypothetical protein [Bryobacteraceae bacterium]
MDVQKLIRQLTAEKEALERAILEMETLLVNGGAVTRTVLSPKRRGRKSMSIRERREVSARMKAYWANRRKERLAG